MNDSEVELLILHPEWELTNHPECVSHDNLSSHLFQELSKAKAAFVAERAQAEEELGRVRAQVRLEEVSSNFGHLPTHNPSFQRWWVENEHLHSGGRTFLSPPTTLSLTSRTSHLLRALRKSRAWLNPTDPTVIMLSVCVCVCVSESLNLNHP